MSIDAVTNGIEERALATPQVPSVLFIGDSVMDQQGNHAAFLLRESGVAANVHAAWGSSLFTRGQYNGGRTRFLSRANETNVHWLSLAPRLIAAYDPTLTVVGLDHNYWFPYPTDSHGHVISDLSSVQARRMIEKQVRGFISILRSKSEDVIWVAPTPSKTHVRDIWPTMKQVLEDLEVQIVDPNAAVRRKGFRRRSLGRDCSGTQQELWMNDDIHLTRFGAGVTGTALAAMVAERIGVDLIDAAAPGERSVAIVPVASGYYIVQCDGSVFSFGDVPPIASARSLVLERSPVVDAVADDDGDLTLVLADGSEISLEADSGITKKGPGDGATARRMIPTDPISVAWEMLHPSPPIADTEVFANGRYTLTENGEVESAGEAIYYGDSARLARFTK